MDNQDKDRFTAYIKGILTQAEREEIEQLLLIDEEALASYLMSLQLLNHNEGLDHQNNNEMFTFPDIPNQALFTERIMKQVDSSIKREERKKKLNKLQWRHLLSHKVVHYTVAASITVLFISTGVFDRLAPGNVYKSQSEAKPPYSEMMARKATGWLDSLKPKRNQ